MLRAFALGVSLFLAGSALAEGTKPATPEGAPAASPITIEDFGGLPFFQDPSLSPNGQFLAARLAGDGKQTLSIISLFDKSIPTRSYNIDSEEMSLDGWQWVNDEWLVATVSRTVPVEGDTWRVSRIIGIGRNSQKLVTPLWDDAAQNASDILWVARDGSPRLLFGMQTSIFSDEDGFYDTVYEVDISKGKTRKIVSAKAPITSYFADASGFVRMGYGYDYSTRKSRLTYRAPGEGTFHVIDRADTKKDEDLIFPALFLADPAKALTFADDEDGFTRLYDLALPTLVRGESRFGVKGYDIGDIIRNASGDDVAGIWVTEDRPRIQWLDAGLAETQALFDKAVGAGRARIVDWDQSRTKLLVFVGGPDQAGSYYYFNRAGGDSLKLIAFSDEKLKMRHFSAVSTIHYAARDGMDIPAVLTLPKGREAKNLPLILLPHGGPQSRDFEQWDWIAQALAFRGYAVVQPNFRGSTGFGTKHLEAGEGEWGLKMQDDLNDAVDHLAAKGMIDPKRVCILGASYGGYAAMRAAQRDGGRFRCAISYAGVSDLGRMARYDSKFLEGAEFKQSLRKKAPDFDAVSPLRFPEQFSTPILLIHGKLDLRVPVEQSRGMAARLKAAGKTYRYVEQPLGDHHFSRAADRIQFLQETDAFLRQYNPAD
ncbi:MAG: S9 family peptidase [Sphingomonadaceae bacterium]